MSAATTIRFSRTIQTAFLLCLATGVTADYSRADYTDVTQNGGTLSIQGDNDANIVTIVGADDEVGKVAVYIHPDAWIYEGVENIDVDLAGGNDTLKLARIGITGDLTVTAAGGDNVVLVGGWKDYGPSLIGGDVFISTGGGFDAVGMENAWVGGNVAMDTGGNDDFVAFGLALTGELEYAGIETFGNVIDGNLDLLTGSGGDNVFIRKTDLGTALIDTAAGNDFIRLGNAPPDGSGPMDGPVREEEPGDFKTDDGRTSRSDSRSLAGARQVLSAEPTNVMDVLLIYSGAGFDLVELYTNMVQVETEIELEDGNDWLWIAAPNEFHGEFDAHGGSDDDVLDNEPGNYFESSPSFHSFEFGD